MSSTSPTTGSMPMSTPGAADADLPIGQLIAQLSTELGELVGNHVQLAKVEITEEVRTVGRGAGFLSGGVVAGSLALVAFTLAAGWGLAEVMAPGWAFLLVGAVWGIVALVLGRTGRTQLQQVDGPTETARALKEDQKWLK